MCGTELKSKFVFSQELVFQRQMVGCAVVQKRIKPVEKMLQDGGMRREGEREEERNAGKEMLTNADIPHQMQCSPSRYVHMLVYVCVCVCMHYNKPVLAQFLPRS